MVQKWILPGGVGSDETAAGSEVSSFVFFFDFVFFLSSSESLHSIGAKIRKNDFKDLRKFE